MVPKSTSMAASMSDPADKPRPRRPGKIALSVLTAGQAAQLENLAGSGGTEPQTPTKG
jgi:hypothetical protein